MDFTPKFSQVPVEEREYLKDQKAKIGPKDSFQLGPVDKAAIQKHKRNVVKKEKQIDTSPIASASYDQKVILSQSSNSEEIDEEYEPDRHSKSVDSLLKIPRHATELIRGDVSSTLGASLANALLLDLQAMGLLNPSVNIENLFLDKSKIDSAKEKSKHNAHQKHIDKTKETICIGVDGRQDKEIVGADGKKQLKKTKRRGRKTSFDIHKGDGL